MIVNTDQNGWFPDYDTADIPIGQQLEGTIACTGNLILYKVFE